jgi:inorganic phosphate transporter, PiT family
MNVLLIGFTVLMSLAVGWSIGANDAANSLGTAVGSRVINLRQGIILIAIFGFLGAFLQGSHVTATIGKGIIPMDRLDKQTALYVALVACFAACAWVVLATFWKMPISTSHSIVGAVAGAGLAVGAPVKWKILGDIFICWIFTPVGAAVLGYVIFFICKNTFYRVVPRRFVKPVVSALIILSGCYVAYSWGANDVANATGVIVGAGIISSQLSVIIGGAAIVLGIVTWGYKVIETIGSGITHLLPLMAFAAQLASGINVHIYTMFGIPVSTSHSIVGAIFGVGLVKGVKVLNVRILREIVFCWLATPFVSGIMAFIILKGMRFFVKL